MSGIEHFASLLSPFDGLRRSGKVIHHVQTNASLINERWCSLFKEHAIRVGVSIDGPAALCDQRKDWSGRSAFKQITKGIQHLTDSGHAFSAICVVGEAHLTRAKDIYDFFLSLGPAVVGFSIVEVDGVNKRGLDRNVLVGNFWRDLFCEWRKNPAIRIREFEKALLWMSRIVEEEVPAIGISLDLLPSVCWNGDVVLLSPELAGTNAPEYGNFVVGNIAEESLLAIVDKAPSIEYVRQFESGISKCRNCNYFGFCRGGQASNKYFENGSFETTATMFCRQSKMALCESILDELKSKSRQLDLMKCSYE